MSSEPEDTRPVDSARQVVRAIAEAFGADPDAAEFNDAELLILRYLERKLRELAY